MEDVCVVCFALLVIILISRFSFEKQIEEGMIMDELQDTNRGGLMPFKNMGSKPTNTTVPANDPEPATEENLAPFKNIEPMTNGKEVPSAEYPGMPKANGNGMPKANGNGMPKANGNGMPKANGNGMPKPEGMKPTGLGSNGVIGYDDSEVYFSVEASFGSAVADSVMPSLSILNEPTVIKPNLNANIDAKRGAEVPSDSQMPAFDKTAKGGLMDVQKDTGNLDVPSDSLPTDQPAGDKSVEVHFVYAEWCGHSQNALPAFEAATKETGVTTKSGVPVTFVATEESSPDFKMFKGAVRGFPTYMVVHKEAGEVVSKKELPLASRSKDDIIKAAEKLP